MKALNEAFDVFNVTFRAFNEPFNASDKPLKAAIPRFDVRADSLIERALAHLGE